MTCCPGRLRIWRWLMTMMSPKAHSCECTSTTSRNSSASYPAVNDHYSHSASSSLYFYTNHRHSTSWMRSTRRWTYHIRKILVIWSVRGSRSRNFCWSRWRKVCFKMPMCCIRCISRRGSRRWIGRCSRRKSDFLCLVFLCGIFTEIYTWRKFIQLDKVYNNF